MSYLALAALELKAVYALAAALAIGFAALGGTIGIAIATAKGLDALARQPEAEKKIRNSMILGIIFIETALLYALIISILIVINIL